MKTNFYARFLATVTGAALLISLPWAWSCARYKGVGGETWEAAKSRRIHDSMILSLLLYTMISAQALYFFRCQEVQTPDGGNPISYLMADCKVS
jgi:hypothetical protein